jgi:tetratricopeptide (TPR) repeat protein
MSVLRQYRLARTGSVLSVLMFLVVGAVVAARRGALPLAWSPVVAVVLWATWHYVPRLVVTRAFHRLSHAIDREDYPQVRQLVLELRALYSGSRSMTEWLQLQDASLLSLQGKHAEAAALLQSIDRTRLHATLWPMLLNNLAWSLALSGRPDEGVSRARESIEAWDKAGNRAFTKTDFRALQLGTLGTALELAGQAAEGVPLLEQALARGGLPRHQAARAFFLGEGLRALGREDDADGAYRRAWSEAPESEFGRKARAAFETRRPYRA